MLKDDKEFRDSFVLEFIKNSIPNQLRALRKERDWTQDDLGRETNKPRNVITRLENPNSHLPNLATLHEIASGCKAALLVQIIPFSELLKEYDKPFEYYYAPPIDSKSETQALEVWANMIDVFNEEGNDDQSASVTAYPYSIVRATTTNEPVQPKLVFGQRPELAFSNSTVETGGLSELTTEFIEDVTNVSEVSDPNFIYMTATGSR